MSYLEDYIDQRKERLYLQKFGDLRGEWSLGAFLRYWLDLKTYRFRQWFRWEFTEKLRSARRTAGWKIYKWLR